MNRIVKTAFPGKLIRKANVNYINVPASVVERMDLKEGDYLDVLIRFPKRREMPETENEE